MLTQISTSSDSGESGTVRNKTSYFSRLFEFVNWHCYFATHSLAQTASFLRSEYIWDLVIPCDTIDDLDIHCYL